jgi:hypothetical protein
MTKGNTGSGKIRAPRIEKTPPKIVTDALAAKAGAGKVKAPRIVKTPPKIVTDKVKGKGAAKR